MDLYRKELQGKTWWGNQKNKTKGQNEREEARRPKRNAKRAPNQKRKVRREKENKDKLKERKCFPNEKKKRSIGSFYDFYIHICIIPTLIFSCVYASIVHPCVIFICDSFY